MLIVVVVVDCLRNDGAIAAKSQHVARLLYQGRRHRLVIVVVLGEALDTLAIQHVVEHVGIEHVRHGLGIEGRHDQVRVVEFQHRHEQAIFHTIADTVEVARDLKQASSVSNARRRVERQAGGTIRSTMGSCWYCGQSLQLRGSQVLDGQSIYNEVECE